MVVGIALAGLVTKLAYDDRPSQHVVSMLKLRATPASIRDIHCKSWSWTDDLETCTFSVDPAEFPVLLGGWRFQAKAASGGSYAFSGGPKLGPEFEVVREYEISPPEFKHGGRVSLVHNSSRSRAQVDYYEE